jgi:hypothetical protein
LECGSERVRAPVELLDRFRDQEHLEARGALLRGGTIVDATLIVCTSPAGRLRLPDDDCGQNSPSCHRIKGAIFAKDARSEANHRRSTALIKGSLSARFSDRSPGRSRPGRPSFCYGSLAPDTCLAAVSLAAVVRQHGTMPDDRDLQDRRGDGSLRSTGCPA